MVGPKKKCKFLPELCFNEEKQDDTDIPDTHFHILLSLASPAPGSGVLQVLCSAPTCHIATCSSIQHDLGTQQV